MVPPRFLQISIPYLNQRDRLYQPHYYVARAPPLGFSELPTALSLIVSEVRAKKKDQIPFLSVNISFLSACSYICSVKNGPNFWRANLFVWIRRGDNDDVTQCKIAIYLSKRLEYIGLLKQVRFFSLNHKMQTLPCNGMGCHHSKNT